MKSKTPKIDYGPDNVSTLQDIGETNVFEELMYIKEVIEVLVAELDAKRHLPIKRDALIQTLKALL